MTLIKSLLIFYPLIIPVWQQGPFDSHNIERAESLDFLQNSGIKFQVDTFQKIKDPNIRGRMALDLINANNPEAVNGLTYCYTIEKNDFVKINILTALYQTKNVAKTNNAAMLKACLQNENPMLRGYGSALYLDKTKDPAPVLKMLGNESTLFVKNLNWSDLKNCYQECPEDQLEILVKADDLVNRAGAARILAMKTADPDQNATLQRASSDKDVAVRALLTEGLAFRAKGGAKLLEKMSKDKTIQVRAFAASAKAAPDRVNMHIALSTDSDPEVRRLAVVAFRYYKEPAAIDALLKAMNDPDKPVRTAAEDSLIAMKAAPAILERVGKEYLDQKPATHSAVRVLGALNDQRFNDKILNILNSTTDTDMMRRAINALRALDYKKAAASVAAKASSPDPMVRTAVGHALGVFNIKDTFDTLVKLSADTDDPTSLAAIKGMGVTRDPYFIDYLLGIAKDVKRSSNRRSYSYWSLAQINQPSKSQIKLLQKNITKKIIPIPMSPPEYDSDFARIGATLTLIELGEKDNSAKETAEACIKKLRVPTEQQIEYLSGETLQEYARQAELYLQGKPIEKVPLPTASPVLTVQKYKKRR